MSNSLIEEVKTLFEETFGGPRASGGCFTESKPNSGIFGTLEMLSAEEASIPVHGTTIAAHADHTRYYLWGANSISDGKDPEFDWEISWNITTVNEAAWTQIKNELHHEYTTLLQKVESISSEKPEGETANEAMASIAHSAYHLGAIRQMVKAIKGSEVHLLKK